MGNFLSDRNIRITSYNVCYTKLLRILEKDDFDDLLKIEVNGIRSVISTKIAGNLYIKKQ